MPGRGPRPAHERWRPMKLIRLLLHPDAGGRLDERIDRPACQSFQRCATTAWMGNRGMVLQQIDFALQVNLNDLPIQRCPRKMAGATFPEKQMKHDAVKGRVL